MDFGNQTGKNASLCYTNNLALKEPAGNCSFAQVLLTEGMLGFDCRSRYEGFALSMFVDSADAEVIFLTFVEIPGCGLCALDDSGTLLPTVTALWLLLQDVLLNTSSSVVLRWVPLQCDGVGIHLNSLQGSFGRGRLVYNTYTLQCLRIWKTEE